MNLRKCTVPIKANGLHDFTTLISLDLCVSTPQMCPLQNLIVHDHMIKESFVKVT